MRAATRFATVVGFAALSACSSMGQSNSTSMSFFVTSAGSGNGADLGGLAGADRHCQALASAAGAGKPTWRAYLSTTAAGGEPAINARDRIGNGPLVQRQGRVDRQERRRTARRQQPHQADRADREGRRRQRPRRHAQHARHPDRLAADGTPCHRRQGHDVRQLDAASGDGAAMVGHHDRLGLRDDAPSQVVERLASRRAAAARRRCRHRRQRACSIASPPNSAYLCYAYLPLMAEWNEP